MEESLEALRPRMDLKNYVKLQAIKIPRVHQFIAEASRKNGSEQTMFHKNVTTKNEGRLRFEGVLAQN